MKKTIIVGVTSSIAAYKSVQLVSDLLKKGYDVEVIMSKNATQFIQPLTFSTLTKHKTYVDTFDREVEYNVEHISLAEKADAFIIAPASANTIAKVAHGICDDMLTTTFLASTCPKMIAPAMNTNMLENPITQDNLTLCKKYGMHIVDSEEGKLACDAIGKGKLANITTLIEAIEMHLQVEKPLIGKKVLISAGPTIEKLDPVRFISNHSSGKMGYALARAARNLGAEITLVSGPTSLAKPYGVNTIDVESAQEMFEAITSIYETQDYVIKAAAVSDFKPAHMADHKIKKESSEHTLSLLENKDILKYLGEHKTHQKVCGFAMETENVIANAQKKRIAKHCDILVVNNLLQEGAGFQKDTNVVTILSDNKEEALPLMSKEDLALCIIERLLAL